MTIASEDDLLSRLRKLEGRLHSLSGSKDGNPEEFRRLFTAHETRSREQYALALRQASGLASELSRATDRWIAPKLLGMEAKALAGVSVPDSKLFDKTYTRVNLRLEEVEAEIPATAKKFSVLQASAAKTNARLAAAGDQLDELWKHQESSGLGRWREVMRAVATEVERNTSFDGKKASYLEDRPVSAPRYEKTTGLVRVKRCSHCQTQTVRRVKRESVTEDLLRFVFVAPYRCMNCLQRSYRVQ